MKQELILSSRWSTPESRRREGLKAAHQQDREALKDLLQSWITQRSRRGSLTSEHTRRAYLGSLDLLLEFCGPADHPSRHLHQLKQDDAEHFNIWLQQRLSPTSVSRHIAGARACCRALKWAGVLDNDPFDEVHAPISRTSSQETHQVLSHEQVNELLLAPDQLLDTEPGRASRDQTLLCLGVTMGLRVSEIIGLSLGDIEQRGNRMQLRIMGKGNKIRRLPVPQQAQAIMVRWLSLRGAHAHTDESALLVSFGGPTRGRRMTTDGARFVFNNYWKQLGFPQTMRGMHTLRRSAGTHLYRATRDLHLVADVLGHSNIQTTSIYARMDDEGRAKGLELIEQQRLRTYPRSEDLGITEP